MEYILWSIRKRRFKRLTGVKRMAAEKNDKKQVSDTGADKTTKKTQVKKETKTKNVASTKPKTTKPTTKKSVKPVKAKKVSKTKAKPKSGVKDERKKAKKEEDDEEIEIVEEEEELEEDDYEYIVKQKPELTPVLKKQLNQRRERKRKKPKFRRQEWFRYKRLGDSWRKPRGLHSKLRVNKKYRINRVRVGYKTPEVVRGLHSSGFRERLVYNRNDLEMLDPKLEAARIGHSVGTKKRIEIEEYADELGIRVLNRG
jgi:large subunit ribosomal protein L32e